MVWKFLTENVFYRHFFKKGYSDSNDIIPFNDISKLASSYHREIFIDTITPIIANDINRQIRFWNSIDEEEATPISERKPINVYIDSYGGSLTAAFTIIDTIKMSKTPINTINIGTAYKEAFFVYLAGYKRLSYPRASFELELKMTQFIEDDTQSNHNVFCEGQNLELKSMVLDKTKVTENDYEKRNSIWMTADKAYELKVCNEVLRNY